MNSGGLPDRPPRKRERPKWPAFLLIVGMTLTVVGLVLTVGPFALEPGETDSPSLDDSADDPADTNADDDGDGSTATDVDGDEATGSEEISEAEENGLRGLIAELSSGGDGTTKTDNDETREECTVE